MAFKNENKRVTVRFRVRVSFQQYRAAKVSSEVNTGSG
jgi:hypothetical protein